jgi:hypothetical protein
MASFGDAWNVGSGLIVIVLPPCLRGCILKHFGGKSRQLRLVEVLLRELSFACARPPVLAEPSLLEGEVDWKWRRVESGQADFSEWNATDLPGGPDAGYPAASGATFSSVRREHFRRTCRARQS